MRYIAIEKCKGGIVNIDFELSNLVDRVIESQLKHEGVEQSDYSGEAYDQLIYSVREYLTVRAVEFAEGFIDSLNEVE